MLNGVEDIEGLEIDLLLEAIFQCTGFDFRGHARGPLREKLRGFMQAQGLDTVSAVQAAMLHDAGLGDALLAALVRRPVALFEDAARYCALRDMLSSWLRSSPSPRIWITECVAAEEVFGIAVLLQEEGLLERTQLYATGCNEALLAEAARGSFAASRFDEYEANYRASGGRAALADHVRREEGRCVFAPELGARIAWSQYNLATDASFNEFELILCHEPIAAFGPALRRRILHLFHDSLARFGMLAVQGIEHPENDPLFAGYTTVLRQPGLYRRVI